VTSTLENKDVVLLLGELVVSELHVVSLKECDKLSF